MNWVIKLSLLITVLANQVYAKDLGNFGHTQEIAEDDLLLHIESSFKSISEERLREHQEKISKKIVAGIKRPKAVSNVTKSTESKVRFFDPSIVTDEDIIDAYGNIIHAKGTRLNPLDFQSFFETWLMIDGDDEQQIKFATDYRKDSKHNRHDKNNDQNQGIPNTNNSIKIILVKGTPGEQQDGSYFYFDQFGEISKKLDLSKVPAIIRQSADRKLIEIEEVLLDENTN